MIDSKAIIDYCYRYYGYGKLNSEIAIIGIEEGEKKEYHTLEKAKKRIKTTLSLLDKSGSPLIDFLEAHKIHSPEQYKKIMAYKSFSPYWNKVTRVVMAMNGIDEYKAEKVMDYFKNSLIKNTAMLDFRPLFSTGIETWKYKNWSNLEQLKSREKYYNWIDRDRINKIQNFIDTNNYKLVLVFGTGIKEQFEKIINLSFDSGKEIKNSEYTINLLKNKNTLYALVPQSVRTDGVGSVNRFYQWVGNEIKKNIKTTNNRRQ